MGGVVAIVRYDGTEALLPSVANLDMVLDQITRARAGENGGWATFSVLRGDDRHLAELKVQVVCDKTISLVLEEDRRERVE